MTTTDTTTDTVASGNGTTATAAAAPVEPVEAVPADGRWAIVALMGHKTIAGRVTVDELLGGGTVLVQTPAADGVTLRTARSFNPATSLYLANWCTRDEVLRFLYPPVPAYQLALTSPEAEGDDEDEDLF